MTREQLCAFNEMCNKTLEILTGGDDQLGILENKNPLPMMRRV